MFTRIVELTTKPGKNRELQDTVNDKVLQILKKQKGFVDEMSPQVRSMAHACGSAGTVRPSRKSLIVRHFCYTELSVPRRSHPGMKKSQVILAQ